MKSPDSGDGWGGVAYEIASAHDIVMVVVSVRNCYYNNNNKSLHS